MLESGTIPINSKTEKEIETNKISSSRADPQLSLTQMLIGKCSALSSPGLSVYMQSSSLGRKSEEAFHVTFCLLSA